MGNGYADDKVTLEACAKFCDGFAYFATEYGRECYCGNELQQGSVKAGDQNDCAFPCVGDASEYCGAGNRLQLYKLGSSTATMKSMHSFARDISSSDAVPGS